MLCSTSDESDTKWTIIIKHNMHNSEIRVLLLTRNMLSQAFDVCTLPSHFKRLSKIPLHLGTGPV